MKHYSVLGSLFQRVYAVIQPRNYSFSTNFDNLGTYRNILMITFVGRNLQRVKSLLTTSNA